MLDKSGKFESNKGLVSYYEGKKIPKEFPYIISNTCNGSLGNERPVAFKDLVIRRLKDG